MPLEEWVVDASVPKNVRGVRVGEAWVPNRFSVAAAKGYGDIDVVLTCSTTDGRRVDVRDCRVSSPDPNVSVTTSMLRQVPVPGLAKLGMWSLAMRRDPMGRWERVVPDNMRHRWTDVTVWQTVDPDDEVPRTAIQVGDLAPEWVAHLESEYGKLVGTTRGVGVRTDEWWRRVERAYGEALENRQPTGDAVARAMHLSIQAAKNAITEARKRGYNLPKRGRVK